MIQDIEINAKLNGQLYVREKRTYDTDEEQPDAGTPLNLGADAIFRITNLEITPQWEIKNVNMIAEIRIDEPTRNAWHNKYGNGDEFTLFVETIFNHRATNYLNRLDATFQICVARRQHF